MSETKELHTLIADYQQKLSAISKLTNIMQHSDTTLENCQDIAYFIHQIIEASEWTSELARELVNWQISAK